MIAKRNRFCVVCGCEETTTIQLRDGLCPKCSVVEQPEIKAQTIPPIRLCRICESLEEKGKWLPRSSKGSKEDLLALLKRIMTKSIKVNAGNVLEVTIPKMPSSVGSCPVTIPVLVKVKTGDQQQTPLLNEFSTTVRLVPVTCPNCSLMKREYYEATLQIRTRNENMTSNEKMKLLNQVSLFVEKISRRNKKAFISKYEERPKGLDLYLGSNQLAYALASKFRDKKGVMTKETFKAGKVDKSSGNRKNKITILITIPQAVIDELE